MNKKTNEITRKFADPSVVDANSVLKQDDFLTDVLIGIRANEYVMQGLLPEKPVRKDTDKIRVINPQGYFKALSRREDSALPEQYAVQYDQDTYSTDEFAGEGWVTDDAVRNSLVAIDPIADEAGFLADKIMLTQEIATINEIFNAAKAAGLTHYDILAAGTANWNGGTSSAPLQDISNAIVKITKRIGKRPNTISMSTDSIEAFINNAQVLDVLKRTSTEIVESAAPINMIRGMKVVLADACANQGEIDSQDLVNIQYDVSTSTQFFDTAVVSYVNPSDPLTLGRNFVSKPFTAYRGRSLEGDRRQSTLVAVWKKFGPKVTNVGASHIIAKVLG